VQPSFSAATVVAPRGSQVVLLSLELQDCAYNHQPVHHLAELELLEYERVINLEKSSGTFGDATEMHVATDVQAILLVLHLANCPWALPA
jgi:hypothetical protein